MLKKSLQLYLSEHNPNHTIELFEIEKDYVERHQLIVPDTIATAKKLQFELIERCSKETEKLISTADSDFLDKTISYLKRNREEFVYAESNAFERIRVDAIVLEFDDVFETYSALLGLKLQKKFGGSIKNYLDTHLHGDGVKYSVLFSEADGLWDLNFTLDYVEGFKEDLSFTEIVHLIFQFIFRLIETIEAEQ